MRNTLTDFVSSEYVMVAKLVLVFLIGPLDVQLTYLLVAMIIDLYFGIKVAKKENNFSFFVLRDKLQNKLLVYIMWIILFHAFDIVTGLNDTARWSVIILLVAMEILSSIKNTSKLGYSSLANALESIYLALVKGNVFLSFLNKENEDKDTEGGKNNEKDDESKGSE